MSQEKMFMHINDVHYKNQNEEEGRPAPKVTQEKREVAPSGQKSDAESVDMPFAAPITPSEIGAKLSSGSYGKEVPQKSTNPPQHLNSIKNPIMPKLVPVPASSSGASKATQDGTEVVP